MAIDGKVRYSIYLDPESVEIIRTYLSGRKNSGGLSELLDKYVVRCAKLIKNNPIPLSEIEEGKMTLKKFVKLAMLDV